VASAAADQLVRGPPKTPVVWSPPSRSLEPEGTGTRLFLVHDGFYPDSPYQLVSRQFMGSGSPGVLARIAEDIDEKLD
jgi:hypothetical protein